MKTKTIALLIILITTKISYGQKLDDIPYFAPEGYNIRDYSIITQGGDGQLRRGEYVIWRYAFDWHAIVESTGQRIKLEQNRTDMLINGISGRKIQVRIKGMNAVINMPNNIPRPEALFNFGQLSLQHANKDIVLNRLGRPQGNGSDDDGEYFIYSKTVTLNRTRYVTSHGTMRGTIGDAWNKDNFDATTTTTTPVKETITYQPYHFQVHFNDRGVVSKVVDLVDRSITWIAK